MTGRTTPAASPKPLERMATIPEHGPASLPPIPPRDSLESAKSNECNCWTAFKDALTRFGRCLQETFTALWEKICLAWKAMIACCYPKKEADKPVTPLKTTAPLPSTVAALPGSLLPPPAPSGGRRTPLAPGRSSHHSVAPSTPLPTARSKNGVAAAPLGDRSARSTLVPGRPGHSAVPLTPLPAARSKNGVAAAPLGDRPAGSTLVPGRPGHSAVPLTPLPAAGNSLLAPPPRPHQSVPKSDVPTVPRDLDDGGNDTVASVQVAGDEDGTVALARGDDGGAALAAMLEKPKASAVVNKRIPAPERFLTNLKAAQLALLHGTLDGYARCVDQHANDFRAYLQTVTRDNADLYQELHPLEVLAFHLDHHLDPLSKIFSSEMVGNAFLKVWVDALNRQGRVADYLPHFYERLSIDGENAAKLDDLARRKNWKEFCKHALAIGLRPT